MNILAIGSHPDDIEFGCGGTLLKYARSGHNVYLLVLSEGGFGGEPQIRKEEQNKAAKFMKAKELFWGGAVDTEIAQTRQLIAKMDEIVDKAAPDIVFLNYFEDTHQDHREAAEAGITATRYIKEVLFYEVPTTLRFEPDIFVDIEDALDDKLELLRIHASQVEKTRVPNLTIMESAESCAYFRGFQGRVRLAEGFKALRLLRMIR